MRDVVDPDVAVAVEGGLLGIKDGPRSVAALGMGRDDVPEAGVLLWPAEEYPCALGISTLTQSLPSDEEDP